MKRKRPKLSVKTAQAAYKRYGGNCAGCGKRATEWHHVLSQQKFPEFIDEIDNVLPLCRSCHWAHTSAIRRLPRRSIGSAEGLPLTPAMHNYLDRTYGPKPKPIAGQGEATHEQVGREEGA
jgi:hypothetical protein